MRSQLLALTLLCSTACLAAVQSVETLWKFPVGTWVENLIVRPNGFILATILNPSPQVYQVDPDRKVPARLVATLPHKHAALGIATYTDSDVYYVIGTNFTLHPLNLGVGTGSVFELDLTSYTGGKPVTPKLVADFPDAGFLNGMTVLNPDTDTLLVADSYGGAGWSLNTKTGKTARVISNPYMKGIKGQQLPLGINGVQVLGPTLYWTNFNQGLIGRARINTTTGAQMSNTTIVAKDVPAADDFVVLSTDFGYVSGNDEVRAFEIGLPSNVTTKSPLVEGSTAIKLGAQRGSYYVSTNGGANQYLTGKPVNPGKIIQVQLNNN